MTRAAVAPRVHERVRRPDGARLGLAAALALMVLGLIVPAVFQWHVHANSFAPLSARWRPRVGWGTVPALVVGVVAVGRLPRWSATLRWSRLLTVGFASSVAWMVALATVDGRSGLGDVLTGPGEYLPTARRVTSVSATLHEFIGRIPAGSAHPWPTHVAGHPPGALLFFVLLVALGLGGGLAAGWTVVLIAATTPLAVLVTLRRLGAEHAARRVMPILTVGPAAVWSAVSADAVFAAVTAWGLCCLACAATARGRIGAAAWSVPAGLLLGCCVFLSYGLVLAGVLAGAILLVARDLRAVIGAVVAALAVAVAFGLAGFSWWDALPVLRERYYDGIASTRPAAYWLWGDLAALCFSGGPVVGASVAAAVAHRRTARPVVLLTLAAAIAVALADVSLLSRAETERIWLPFVPWLLLGTAALDDRWRRRALAGQVALALAIQTLLFTRW